MDKDTALKMAIEQLWSCLMLMNLDHSDYLYEDVVKAHDACKEAIEQPAQEKITRLEVIDGSGRAYTNWKEDEINLSYQDDGKTLKIFVKEKNNE